jgi:hypothetical protein
MITLLLVSVILTAKQSVMLVQSDDKVNPGTGYWSLARFAAVPVIPYFQNTPQPG